MGGLANQLFQVVNVVAFARRRGYIPVFDTSVTNSPSMVAPKPTYWDTVFSKIVILGQDLSIDASKVNTYGDPSYEYQDIHAHDQNLKFWGYFQSYKYFHDYRDYVLDLIVRNPVVIREVDQASQPTQ